MTSPSPFRAGKEDRLFPWGNKWRPHDEYLANTWTGSFPDENDGDDGFKGEHEDALMLTIPDVILPLTQGPVP